MHARLVFGHDPGPFTGAGSNSWFVDGAVPTLIDTGSGRPEHLAELESVMPEARRLERVLATHGHPDHVGGHAAIAARWPSAAFAKFPWPGRDDEADGWTPLRDDESIDAGDQQLWVVHTPGHAPDHVCFFEPRTGTLFGGDLVMNGNTIVIPASGGGSLRDYLASLRRVLDLQPRRILPGHGPVIEQPAALIRAYIAHRLDRERQILAALETGPRSASDIVTVVYPSLDPSLLGGARESVLAHLLKLESNGAAVPDEEGDRTVVRWRRG